MRTQGRWQYLYGSERWRKRARHQLQIEPLCRFCLRDGRVTAAQVADHIEKETHRALRLRHRVVCSATWILCRPRVWTIELIFASTSGAGTPIRRSLPPIMRNTIFG